MLVAKLRNAKTRMAIDASPRARLMTAATELFCKHGINAVGVDAIVERAGTAKTTLYKWFGSKDGLVEAVLLAEGSAWRDWFITTTSAASPTARGRLDAIFPALAQWFRQKRFYGCPFINAVAEHDKSSDRIRNLAMDHKQQVLAYIQNLGAEAGARDPAQLTHEIALLMDGAIVMAMITRTPSSAEFAQLALKKLIRLQIAA
jgi:AcrR family transcriptional regulator